MHHYKNHLSTYYLLHILLLMIPFLEKEFKIQVLHEEMKRYILHLSTPKSINQFTQLLLNILKMKTLEKNIL